MQLTCRRFTCVPYNDAWRAMQTFTDARNGESIDECWLLEHPPVYTLGQAGRREHLFNAMDIPVLECDRGGQVTYHGPGQIVLYTLFDLRRLAIGVRNFVICLENVVIQLLAQYAITATGKRDAPGVYVGGAKVAALGLRVRKGCCYHGLSLNVDMNLQPFVGINPCGYPDLPVTQLRDLGISGSLDKIGGQLIDCLAAEFGYDIITPCTSQWPQTDQEIL